ncbi:hypothetical protein HDV00_006487 [Rhizophlyctis rosea]|nr:hypothetical protein HDV00_006487 [Rhizophlyctis rosea]
MTQPVGEAGVKANGLVKEAREDVPDTATRELDRQQFYVKPEKTQSSPLVTHLTGVSQERIDEAGSLNEAISQIDFYLQSNFTTKGKTFCFVTYGDEDLRFHLPREAREKSTSLPPYFSMYFDINQEVAKWQALQSGTHRNARSTLDQLCTAVQIIYDKTSDDALTVAQVTVALLGMMERLPPSSTADVDVPLRHPIDLAEQLRQFSAQHSKIVRFGQLPMKAIASNVEEWIGLAGVKAESLSIIRMDKRLDGTGFAVFRSHEEAKQCLTLNGRRVLPAGTVVVSPSLQAEYESFESIRTPFPTEEEVQALALPPDMKPGDWLCPVCNHHNVATQRRCPNCHVWNLERPSFHPSSPQIIHPNINKSSSMAPLPFPSKAFTGTQSRFPRIRPDVSRGGADDDIFLDSTPDYDIQPGRRLTKTEYRELKASKCQTLAQRVAKVRRRDASPHEARSRLPSPQLDTEKNDHFDLLDSGHFTLPEADFLNVEGMQTETGEPGSILKKTLQSIEKLKSERQREQVEARPRFDGTGDVEAFDDSWDWRESGPRLNHGERYFSVGTRKRKRVETYTESNSDDSSDDDESGGGGSGSSGMGRGRGDVRSVRGRGDEGVGSGSGSGSDVGRRGGRGDGGRGGGRGDGGRGSVRGGGGQRGGRGSGSSGGGSGSDGGRGGGRGGGRNGLRGGTKGNRQRSSSTERRGGTGGKKKKGPGRSETF